MECAQQKTKTSSIPADSSHAIMGTFTNGSSTFQHQIGNPHKNVTRVEYEQSTPPFNIKYKTLNMNCRITEYNQYTTFQHEIQNVISVISQELRVENLNCRIIKCNRQHLPTSHSKPRITNINTSTWIVKQLNAMNTPLKMNFKTQIKSNRSWARIKE